MLLVKDWAIDPLAMLKELPGLKTIFCPELMVSVPPLMVIFPPSAPSVPPSNAQLEVMVNEPLTLSPAQAAQTGWA